jgi:hypothetical protein
MVFVPVNGRERETCYECVRNHVFPTHFHSALSHFRLFFGTLLMVLEGKKKNAKEENINNNRLCLGGNLWGGGKEK